MDRDHVVMMEKLDKIILHAETEKVDTGLRRRMYALRNLLVIHAGKAQDIKDELTQLIAKNKKKILVIGAATISAIMIPYITITRTSWFLQKPILCKVFPTKSNLYPGEIEVCINGISNAFSIVSGDVDLDLTFMKSETEKIQADVTFWLADDFKLGDKDISYCGEYTTTRIRTYDKGFLVDDKKQKSSSWMHPLVPEDVRIPLWEYVYSQKNRFQRDIPPIEEKVNSFLQNMGAVLATLGSVGVTAYRFFRVGRNT
jgi:hypothetical protein